MVSGSEDSVRPLVRLDATIDTDEDGCQWKGGLRFTVHAFEREHWPAGLAELHDRTRP